MQNIAVILAGGTGSRAGLDIPKQFWHLADGRTVLETCVAAFEANEHIDEIAIVILKEHIEQAQSIIRKTGFQKVEYWIDGGKERWQSSLFAIQALSEAKKKHGPDKCNVLLHDCARPFVSQDIITRICQALKEHRAISVAVPMTDTLYKVSKPSGELESVPQREDFMRAQTPQAFRLDLIEQAYQIALNDANNIAATDDCGIIKKHVPEEPVFIILGEESNRKLTYKEDFVTS